MDGETLLVASRRFTMLEAERAEYLSAVNCLKAAAGLPVAPGRPIRDLLREGSFEVDLACALGSRILEAWPLAEQLGFLESLEPMAEAQKRVHIYAQVYELCRRGLGSADR